MNSYKINDWDVGCWGGGNGRYNCLMLKQVTGVGNFRVEWQADKATLGELTCRSDDGWVYTDFDRRGPARGKAATKVHNRIQETVIACNREALAEVDDTLEVASLIASVTD